MTAEVRASPTQWATIFNNECKNGGYETIPHLQWPFIEFLNLKETSKVKTNKKKLSSSITRKEKKKASSSAAL